MSARRIVVIDAFSTNPFEGNPCAVIPDADGLSDQQMQSIAKEVNLSETSFVLSSNKADFRVRYFTPRGELGFAGHPTIATAFMLGLEGKVPLDQPITTIQLEFNIGVLPVDIHAVNGKIDHVVMTQSKPVFGEKETADIMISCFKNLSTDDLIPDCPPQIVGTGTNFMMLPIKDLKKIANLEMNRDKLAAVLKKFGVSAVYAFTTHGFSEETRLHGRLCDPLNLSEDPFTGSAAGAAGSYMAHYGLAEKGEIPVEQGHFIGRPGFGKLEIIREDNQIKSVKLGGAAVKVIDGIIEVG